MNLSQQDVDRFWVKVDKSGDCWNWTASRIQDKNGNPTYGAFWLQGRPCAAHRLSYIITHGSILEGMHVLHECDNMACVKPEHLWLGTMADNMADKVAKGRQTHCAARGDQHYRMKVTDLQVQEMRRRYDSGEASYQELAAEYQIIPGHAYQIVRRVVRKIT